MITTTNVKTVFGDLHTIVTIHNDTAVAFTCPSHPLFVRTQPAPASFLVMAILTHLTRTQVLCWFNCRQQLLSSFRRHEVIRRSMASDATSTEITRFDFLVIGGGSGGLAGARRASELGASTAVIESHKLGGTCVSKTKKTPLFPTTVTVLSQLRLTNTFRLLGLLRNLRTAFMNVFFVYCEHCWRCKASQPYSPAMSYDIGCITS